MKTRRFLLIIAIVLICSCLLCDFSVTEAKTKKIPKQLLKFETSLFNGMKKLDYKKMNKYIISGKLKKDNSSFALMIFLKEKAKKINYKVISNSVSGKSATAKVQFKYLDCSQVGELLISYLVIEQFSHMGEDEYMEGGSKYDELIRKCVRKAIKDAKCNKYKNVTIKLKFKKSGSLWKVKKFDDKLSDVMLSGFISGSNKAIEEMNMDEK